MSTPSIDEFAQCLAHVLAERASTFDEAIGLVVDALWDVTGDFDMRNGYARFAWVKASAATLIGFGRCSLPKGMDGWGDSFKVGQAARDVFDELTDGEEG